MKKAFIQKLMSLAVLVAVTSLTSHAQAALDELDDVMSPDEIAAESGMPSVQEAAALQLQDQSDGQEDFVIVVDDSPKGTTPTSQTLQAYYKGQLKYNWKVSTGRNQPELAKSGRHYFSSTPVGLFHIQTMEVLHHSKLWDAPMPNAMFFFSGVAIHATTSQHIAALGRRDSGGCVRLHPAHAAEIFKFVANLGPKNVAIVVHNGFDE